MDSSASSAALASSITDFEFSVSMLGETGFLISISTEDTSFFVFSGWSFLAPGLSRTGTLGTFNTGFTNPGLIKLEVPAQESDKFVSDPEEDWFLATGLVIKRFSPPCCVKSCLSSSTPGTTRPSFPDRIVSP